MLGMWIAIGAGIGVALGNIGAGVGIGVALGAAFAALAAYNQKSKSNITSGPEEKTK